MHIPASSDEAAVLRWTLDQLAKEPADMRPGGTLMSEHLGYILFVNVLRAHMTDAGEGIPGWSKGLSDPRIGRALWAAHASLPSPSQSRAVWTGDCADHLGPQAFRRRHTGSDPDQSIETAAPLAMRALSCWRACPST
jgi:hypothetical protein